MLLVDGDHVVTVVQQHGFDFGADAALDELRIAHAGNIVVGRMHYQAGRADLVELPAHARRQSIELRQRRPRVARQTSASTVAAQHAARDALAHALALYAIGRFLHETLLAADP